jgi:hypothetical protein
MSCALPDIPEPSPGGDGAKLHEASDGWASRPNAPEQSPERTAMAATWHAAMKESGSFLPGYRGDVRWLTFPEP